MKNQCAVNFWKKSNKMMFVSGSTPPILFVSTLRGLYKYIYNHDHFIAYIIHYISLSYTIYHSLYLYIITGLLHAKVEKAWFFFSGWIWQDSVPTGPIGIGDLSCKRVFRFLFTCHQASQLIQFPEWLAEVVVVVDFRNRIVCQILNNLNQTNSGKILANL